MGLKGYDEPVEVHELVADRVLTSPQRLEAPDRRPLRSAMLLAAIVGAPCAGMMVLNQAILALGVGAAGLGSTAAFLDQTAIRVPLLATATLGAVVNLGLALRSGGSEATDAPGWAPSLSGSRGIAFSLGALGVVLFELVAHRMMH